MGGVTGWYHYKQECRPPWSEYWFLLSLVSFPDYHLSSPTDFPVISARQNLSEPTGKQLTMRGSWIHILGSLLPVDNLQLGGPTWCDNVPALGMVMRSGCSLPSYPLLMLFSSISGVQRGAAASSPGSESFIMVSCLQIIASGSSCEKDCSQEWPVSPSALRTDVWCTVVEILDTNLGKGRSCPMQPAALPLPCIRRSWISWRRS